MITAADILKASILIVDDKAANVAVLEQMLRGAGYDAISSTRDPHAVCELHRMNRYDLILLDLQMPGMDGFQVMEGLKEIETGGYLPVLVVTALPDHRLRALKAGAKDFITKPFELPELLLRVHNMLEVRLLHLKLTILNFTRLENSQRLAGLGDWEYDLKEHRLVWSEGMYRILGISRKAYPPNTATFDRLVHPDDLAFVQLEKKAVAEGSRCADFEHRIVRPDGAVRHFHQVIEVSLDASGRPARESGTMQDITERKLAEGALRASEERYRMLLTLSPDAQFVHVQGRITLVNRAFCSLMGAAEPAQLIGRLAMELVHPDDHTLVRARLQQHSEKQPVPPAEMKFVRLDGTTVNVEVASMAFDFLGRNEVQVAARDITERKRFDAYVLQAQKMEALGQFSGGIAHDFNNILTAIAGYTELSRVILKENPGVRDNLDAVLQASARATALVRQILTFSRQQAPERQSIRLQPVVAESLTLMRATIPATIEFESSLDADAPTVFANPGQIQQVLMNLGLNASHAMKDRTGRLQVTLEKFVIDADFAAANPQLQPGNYVRVSVSDTGRGMDQGTMLRIFEPFFTTKLAADGAGLGLSVVHGIMESHDGAVTVHSQPGNGTVFRLYFPVHAAQATLPATEDGPVLRGHGERVLVVDDEELLALLGEKTLTVLGYEAEIATDSVAALAMVRADPLRYALVLTDQMMPGMTGLVLAHEIRKIQPDLPVILTTGSSLSLTPARLEAAGIRQLLFKPASIRSLGAAVHAALAARPAPQSWARIPAIADDALLPRVRVLAQTQASE